MNIYIIITIIAVLLLVVGATQRKALSTWFRSETKSFIDNNTNTIKVAKLKLSDLKAKKKGIIDQAGELFGLEGIQKKQLKSLKEQEKELLTKAKDAKEADNKDSAIEYLKLANETRKQIDLITENIDTLSKKRKILEINLQKINTYISTNDIRIQGLSSRQAVNNLLKDITVASINEDTLEETIDATEDTIIKDELKLDYLTEDTLLKEEASTELNEAYDKL